jgi:hypothetical protein
MRIQAAEIGASLESTAAEPRGAGGSAKTERFRPPSLARWSFGTMESEICLVNEFLGSQPRPIIGPCYS